MVNEFGPCLCPWCDEVLLDTTEEQLMLRVRMFYLHKPVCPKRLAEAEQIRLQLAEALRYTAERKGELVGVG